MYIRKGAERAFLWSLPHNSPAEKTELQLACSEQSHRLVEPNGLQCQGSTWYCLGVPATAALSSSRPGSILPRDLPHCSLCLHVLLPALLMLAPHTVFT